MIAAVTGGRDLVPTAELASAFVSALRHHGVTVLRHGACRGADTWAAALASALGIKLEAWPADWNKHGRAAGPIRNRRMLTGQVLTGQQERVRVDLLLALPGGRGTADCRAGAVDFGIPVVVIGG